MIVGETVTLWTQTVTGYDDCDQPVIEESPVEVKNVLVTPGASRDLISETDLVGKTISYTLSIPKEDSNAWVNRRVTIRGEDYRTVGIPYYYTPENTPLRWNGRIMVERYE